MGAHAVLQTSPNDELKSLLRSCHLFHEASDEILEFAAQNSEAVSFSKGDCIILEKEANNFVFFVASGSVEIVSYLASENRIQRLALLKAGSHFAEFSVLTNSARSGSAYAFEECVLIRMNGPGFATLLKSFAPVSQKLAQILADIHVKSENSGELIPLYDPHDLGLSEEVLKAVPLAVCQKFGVIPSSFRNGLLTLIMKSPHNRDVFEHFKRSLPQIEIAVQLISEREFDTAFHTAQKSLKKSAPAMQLSAVSQNGSSVLDMKSVFKRSALFSDVREEILQQILTHVQPMEVKAGHNVLTPGAEISSYFVIGKGALQLNRPTSLPQAVSPMMVLKAGDGFGEVQLMSGTPSSYFVRALEDTTLYPVPQNIVRQLFKLPMFNVSVAKALAQKLQLLGHITGIRYHNSDRPTDFKEVADLLPVSLIDDHQILPLQIADGEVLLGIVRPDSSESLFLANRYLLKFRVKLVAITEEQFKTWAPILKSQVDGKTKAAPAFANSKQPQNLDAVKWIDQILLLGMSNRASDIHFEPCEDHLVVRFRIDGVLREHSEKLTGETVKEVISRLKISSDMDIAQQHVPQDGQLKTQIGKVQVLARASAIPVRYGEKIVLRLIRSQSSVVPLAMISSDRRTFNLLRLFSRCRQGLLLVTGPTGSGKTTTLYSLLNAINDVGVNVTTIEDPVEMEIAGFNQIEVDRKRNLDFPAALRSVLRQDPNVIMVGEIRDQESAKIAMDASITGHLVLSTVHTNSSLDVAPRLSELSVTPATLASGLLGVLSQRLVRTNCKKCLIIKPAQESEKAFFREHLPSEEAPESLSVSTGCPACDNTGYQHRLPVFEIWRSTPAMRKALLEGQSPEELMKIARQDGFETLLEAGLRMVLSGVTSLEEVRRVLTGV